MHCSACPTGVMVSLTLTDLTFDSTIRVISAFSKNRNVGIGWGVSLDMQ